VRYRLTHTSGLPVTFGPHPVRGETVPLPMDVYLRDSLAVRGPPMDSVRYSTIGYTLVGYLVQRVSGTDDREYVRHHVLEPLEMRSPDFTPTPAMEERLAIPYVPDAQGRLTPAVHVKANVWPAGLVYGTVLDQANRLVANLTNNNRAHPLLYLLADRALELLRSAPGADDATDP
jgi:CubicO group peptidase (beta-lactamase class C family)